MLVCLNILLQYCTRFLSGLQLFACILVSATLSTQFCLQLCQNLILLFYLGT